MIDLSTLHSPEDVLALSDAELTELCAVLVMSYTDAGARGWFNTGAEIKRFDPLTDYNDTHAVIEAKRREWAEEASKKDRGADKWWRINDAPAWEVAICFQMNEPPLVDIGHPSFARAVCVAAVWDSLQREDGIK